MADDRSASSSESRENSEPGSSELHSGETIPSLIETNMADDTRTDEDETITEQFTCPICIEYMDQKIATCWKGHSICCRCAQRLAKCPICKSGLDPKKRNYALEKVAKLFKKLDRKINEEDFVCEINIRRRGPGDQAGPYWRQACDGEVPENAFPGGYDNSDTLYIARAECGGGLIVGKLHPRYGKAYLPWDCRENEVFDYEVLCNFNGYWEQCHGNDIPSNAFLGGQAENGEPLYVGRAHHGTTTLAVGKVHPSHRVLYISYGGTEYAYKDYEILCQ